MEKQPLSSQGLPFESVSSMTGSLSNRNVFHKQNAVTRKDLSAQIEDNLSRLFECLKLEYGRQILVSPKWKNFGSQTLQFSEKTRLNNAIWRCWHIQYQKNKKPLFCQFVSPLSAEREPPKKPLTVVLQGRYWRRKLDAIAREYKKWRIYYKNKNEGVDESYGRLRASSTGSGDDEVSHGSPLTQVVNLMDLELTTDLVHSHHDTLFTTKTKKVPKPVVSEIVFQPSLDSLQPNLDEFTKHLESLVDSIVQSNEPIQLPSSFLLPRQQDTQGQVEMMDQSSEYKPAYSICNTSASLNTSQTQPQTFMNTTESFNQFPMDYTSQMEIQDYGTSPISQPLSHESIPLTQLEEEPEHEIFTSGTLSSSPVQIPHSASASSLPSYSVSPNTSSAQSHGLPYRHSSSNLQDYGTSPTRKARLPRNVSDNQLSMIDHSQFNLGLPFGQSQERKIPAKDQFPNLVAYLQATTSGPTDTTASQAKRPRIPRNMSDSKLYNTSAGGLHPGHLHNNQNFTTSPPQQTPLEQIQSQAAQQKQAAINASQSKTRTRRGKLPRNMSDSSLMYMNQQQMNTTTLTSMQRRKSLDPNRALSPPTSQQSAHPVFSSTLAEPHEVNEAMRQGSLSMSTSSMMGAESLEQEASLMDQLAQISSVSLPQPSQEKFTQSSVLSQLLNQGESSSLVQKEKEPNNHAMKQVFNILQKPETSPKLASSQDASVNQLSSHLMSLLQNSGNQDRNMMPPHSVTPVVTTQSQQQLPLQSQQVELQQVSLQPQQQQLQQQLLPQPQQQQQLISQQQQLQKHLLPQAQQQQQQFLPPQQQQQFLQTQQQQQHLSPQPHHQQQLQHQQQSLSQQQQQQQLFTQQQQQQQQQQKQLFGQQQQAQQITLQPQQQHQLSGDSQESQLQPQISLQPVQHEIQKQQQVMQQFREKGQTYPLEQQLQQLIQQQQQLKQQLQENQQSSQLISALQATNNALQEHLTETQQYQLVKQEQRQVQLSHQQGVVFTDSQEPKATTINIQPKPVNTQSVPATILIAPQPQSSHTGVQQRQVSLASVPTNVVSLQQILQGTSVSQGQATYKLGSTCPVVSQAATSGQQTKVINSSVDSFSQALFPSCTSVAFSTSNTAINTSVTTAIDTSSSIAVPLAPANMPKFTRPVLSSDRLHYREHRRQSHISAEQKRRFNIKVGFDQLISLVPALACQKNTKVSKAMILHKSYDYITKLQRERDKVLEEQEMLRKESQQLFASISHCQQKLPAFGVPLNRQRNDQMIAFFNQHVKSRTQENYKFWVLSVMFRQMFDSYNQKVTGNTWEEFCTSILSWMDEQCTLPTLRPAVLSALRDISRTTSILTDPSRVPQEIQRHVTTHEDPTNLSERAQPAATAVARNYFENTS